MMIRTLGRLQERRKVNGFSNMSRVMWSLTALLAGIFMFLGMPERATAGDTAGLAAPGPCAEPREAITGIGASDFSVVGPVAALLSPVDVAGGPISPVLPPPVSAGLARPGPCDAPGSGCGRVQTNSIPGTTSIPGTNKPIVPGGPPPSIK